MCQISGLYHKTHNPAIFCHISVGLITIIITKCNFCRMQKHCTITMHSLQLCCNSKCIIKVNIFYNINSVVKGIDEAVTTSSIARNRIIPKGAILFQRKLDN